MVKTVIEAMNNKGYVVFEDDSKPFNLNYVGIRDENNVNSINDWFVMFWKYKGIWNHISNMGTTDPGLHYMKKLLNKAGVAILAEDQHRGVWTCGYHQQKRLGKSHPALIQLKPVGVHRDANKDGTLDLTSKLDVGFHGINHHRMLKDAEAKEVGRHSAGCQVRLNDDEHHIFYDICGESEENWGKGLSYTLLNIKDL